MPLDIIFIVVVPMVLVLILLGFVTLNRYISYKEKVELAKLGVTERDLKPREALLRQGNRGVLWGGVITMMSGLALLLGLATLGTGIWLIAGLLPLFVGLGMLLIYYITAGTQSEQEGDGQEEEPDLSFLEDAFDSIRDEEPRSYS